MFSVSVIAKLTTVTMQFPSRRIGFSPHRDFSKVERIFGDVSADASDAVLRFGHGGKPVYNFGPDESDVKLECRHCDHRLLAMAALPSEGRIANPRLP